MKEPGRGPWDAPGAETCPAGAAGPPSRAARLVLAFAVALVSWPAQAGTRPGVDADRGSPARIGAPVIVRVEAHPPERVRLSVSVLDGNGRPVIGLAASDFIVREAGIRQALLDFGREVDRHDRPLSAVLLVDRSESCARQLGKWRDAGAALLGALRPTDEVRVAAFTDAIEMLQDFTSDPAALAAGLATVNTAGGGTRLFDAVERTLADLRGRPGRKVIFLLTDGLDNVHPGAWSVGTDPYLNELLRAAVRGQVTIITILPGPTGYPYLAAQDLAVQSGGWWLYPSDDLPGLIRRLGERLMASYYLAYDSVRAPEDLRKRPIEILLDRPDLPGLQVRTVSGVFGEAPLLDLLAADLSDGDEERRARAAAELGHVADEDAGRILVRALKDHSPKVRAAAAESLGLRGAAYGATPLARLLRDADPAVRAAAASALRRLLASSPEAAVQDRILDALARVDRP